MLIPISVLSKSFDIFPNSVLHIGAHTAEEYDDYELFNWGLAEGVIWIEAQSSLIPYLENRLSNKKIRNTVINAAIWDTNDKLLSFKISNNSQSSSFLGFGTHLQHYPDIKVDSEIYIKTSRIDSLHTIKRVPEFVNLDIQGAELNALISFGKLIKDVKWIYTEVNREQVYENCPQVEDIDSYLNKFKFKRVATVWQPNSGWGDALYIKDYRNFSINLRILWKTKFVLWRLFEFLKKVLRKIKRLF